ncbi:hypothetical protein [Singulisphaera sp. PoT]|uniref:hypothetical protein n=1 Tax=Singulisphaera sp. PoT TaxID=3411797 RepID=UPI003BF53BCC
MTELACLVLVLPFAVAIVLASWRLHQRRRGDREPDVEDWSIFDGFVWPHAMQLLGLKGVVPIRLVIVFPGQVLELSGTDQIREGGPGLLRLEGARLLSLEVDCHGHRQTVWDSDLAMDLQVKASQNGRPTEFTPWRKPEWLRGDRFEHQVEAAGRGDR